MATKLAILEALESACRNHGGPVKHGHITEILRRRGYREEFDVSNKLATMAKGGLLVRYKDPKRAKRWLYGLTSTPVPQAVTREEVSFRRRGISVRGTTYALIRDAADFMGLSVSGYVEHVMGKHIQSLRGHLAAVAEAKRVDETPPAIMEL